MNSWGEIEDNLQQVMDTKSMAKVHIPFLVSIIRRRKIKNLFHDLLSFRAKKVFVEGSRHERYRSLYDRGKHKVFLKRYLDEEIENMYKYPSDDIIEMVKFEEERTTKTFEWAAVLLAAILGGIVGSFVTHLVKRVL